MRIFVIMKTRVNLTIEDRVLKNTKLYAEKKGTSVSELVEDFFKNITEPKRRSNLFKLIDELPAPDITPDAELKELYYEEKAKKYGF